MPFVVCDSSFLILISKLEMIDLLFELFDRIEIPQAVYIESVKAGKKLKKLDAFMIEERVKDKKIIVETIKKHENKKDIMNDFNIHEGEAETILLYLQKSADLLATDDYRTLKICRILNIKYVTTPLFIILCHLKEKISKEKSFLKFNKLQELGWYKEEIIIEFKNKLISVEDNNGKSNFG
jgi:predicted nucleic acid-binding protein